MAETPRIPTVDALRSAVRSLMPRARTDLAELVSMRSIADPRQAPPQECARAAGWVRDAFAATGIGSVELIETSDGSSAVIGHRPGPAGAPTVLLYCHYDIQPAGDERLWDSDPFTLTERDGRWYGRGAADCKGNLAVHLTALRALDDVLPAGELPVGVRIVAEGSEEMGTGGLEDLVHRRPDLFEADLIVVADAGNVEVGVPTVTTTLRGIANVVVRLETLTGEVHSGMFGGAAPDALTALVTLLGTLHDDRGNTTVDGLDRDQPWSGAEYPAARFRADAGVLDGVELVGSGTVAEQVWARPALTVLGIDCPPVVGSAAAIPPRASARLNLRVPPGMDPQGAQDALVAHLHAHTPWGARVTVEREATGAPFAARTDGPGYRALAAAMAEAFGAPMVASGQGGSIPLCNALAERFPDAEIALIGVEEPQCRIHAPNESVDPAEIERLAVAEALLLARLTGQK
ncbi:dipeptidase [Rhodococcus sp. D2-41]|uniref:Dipeptidase n=1 Tax=Speluncibacter jeojiensis TaxID=2710754 RepID=A0A9X4RDZ9_9ACTN|nr:dipeptidase [Rhodococcus sp. D2-41]MDG3012519.1 dipeptidase [Rhodococcus sp. D2-41]MDG3015364.1 dipeptidase [Corynebacteriales bacterium D3-21]